MKPRATVTKKAAAAPLRRKTGPKKSRTYHKGNVAQDLIIAAKRILAKESFEDISVRRLTREVGVTPANFYNHFPSLDALLLSVAAGGFDELSATSARIAAAVKNRRKALIAICVDFVEFAMANKQLFRIMFGQIPNANANEAFRLASDKSFGELTNFIYRTNLYDPSDIRGVHIKGRAAYAVFGLVYGLARNIIEDQFQFSTGTRDEIHEFVEAVTATLFDGTVARELDKS
jgi:AcrR family transcriptional regulator